MYATGHRGARDLRARVIQQERDARRGRPAPASPDATSTASAPIKENEHEQEQADSRRPPR